MPKIDTRKKTRKQKEKNRRRKKSLKARSRLSFFPDKGLSLFDRLRRLSRRTFLQSRRPGGNAGQGGAKIKIKSKSATAGAVGSVGSSLAKTLAKSRRIRKPSMQAIHGVVANAYASRMPVGSNHTKGIYANTETGLSSKDFFKRTLRQMKRVQNPNLPPTYSYQTRPPAIYPESIHVQPAGLAEPSKSLHDALRALPAASVPRGQRFLKEARAVPIGTGLAEPGMPDWGQMYEATEEGRGRVTRAMTPAELGKEDAYTRVQADMRTGGPGPSMGIWAPSRVRVPENNGSPRGSISSRESARKDGRRRLSMAEEHAFLQHYPPRAELVALAKTHTPAGQQARAEIRRLTNAVFSNSNSSLSGSTESYVDGSPTASDREFQQMMMGRMITLTVDEVQRLRNLGLEHMIPAANLSQLERQVAIAEIRDVLADFNSSVESSIQSSIHSQRSFDDPLHLGAGEILLLRRMGPEGVEHIRRATMSADQEIVMDQVAEAREFLSAALLRDARRSRSRSRSRSSQGSLAAYQDMHAAAFPETETQSSGSGPLSSLSSLGSFSTSSTRSRGSRGSRGSTSSRS